MSKKHSMMTRILLSYAFTFMMINLADSASMIIDGLIISRSLGPTLLAAAGLGGTSYQIVALFCGIFAIGLQSTCSSAMSAGDRERTNRCFTIGLLTVSVIALLLTILGFRCLDPLCHLFGADGSDRLLYDGLREYLRGWFVGIPGLIAFTVLCPLVTLDSNKKLVAAATILESTLNILGDCFSVIFWRGDGLRIIYGIGFSSGASFDIVSLLLLSNFLRKRSAFRFDLRHVQLRDIRQMIRLGMPRLTKYACKMLSPLLINRTVLFVGGPCAMAAMAVKSSITGFFLIAGNGVAESVNLLSQVIYEEKDKDTLTMLASDAVKAVSFICTALSVVMFVLSPQLSALFLAVGSEEYRLSVIMIRCFALSLPLNGLNTCVLNYLQGTRRILPAHLQTASHRLFFLALCTVVLGQCFGTAGMFAAIPLSELLVLLAYILVSLFCGRGRTRTEALLQLPKDFVCAEEDSLSFSVTAAEEVRGVSERVQEFCLSHGIDRRRAYFSALCVEETADNVVSHGFRKDKKKHECNIRILLDNGDILLRIRDDCRYFNMKERYELLRDGAPFSGIGIRLVCGIAKEVNYVSILDTNTLIIRV